MTKLFFSGEVSANSPLRHWCEKSGWELTTQSLLRFEPLSFTLETDFDVIFFSSPRSVNYFISQFKIPSNTKLACIGKSTASALKAQNLIPDFIGEKSGNPEQVATDFKDWLGQEMVLFPLSERSNETIAAVIPNTQRMIVRCYKTVFAPQEILPQDIYVFTSPSNIDSFLLKNNFPVNIQIIAWGKTTNDKLVELNYKSHFVLQESSQEELVNYLSSSLEGGEGG